jgi:hypothetical protein
MGDSTSFPLAAVLFPNTISIVSCAESSHHLGSQSSIETRKWVRGMSAISLSFPQWWNADLWPLDSTNCVGAASHLWITALASRSWCDRGAAATAELVFNSRLKTE